MQYRVETTPTVPVVGGVIARLVKFVVGDIVTGVAKESARRASAGA
jgi:hypothetical protein